MGITFTVFTDLHHNPGVFYTESEKRLEIIFARAHDSKSDFIIHCGDICHDPRRSEALLKKYRDCGLPVYHCMGNHDCDFLADDAVAEIYGMSGNYYSFDCAGFRFIVLDTNYIMTDNGYLHFSAGNYYGYPKEQLYFIPPFEMKWLRDTLMNTDSPCVIFSHHSFERESGGVKNYGEVRWLAENSGRVRLCINGHHHCSHLRILNGICYLDLNSASFHWMGKEHTRYPSELTEKYSLMNRTLVYNTPLSAVITLDADGTIRIEGCSGGFLNDISCIEAGLPPTDSCGRLITADIPSVAVKILT